VVAQAEAAHKVAVEKCESLTGARRRNARTTLMKRSTKRRKRRRRTDRSKMPLSKRQVTTLAGSPCCVPRTHECRALLPRA
jgi:hypothetical protein